MWAWPLHARLARNCASSDRSAFESVATGCPPEVERVDAGEPRVFVREHVLAEPDGGVALGGAYFEAASRAPDEACEIALPLFGKARDEVACEPHLAPPEVVGQHLEDCLELRTHRRGEVCALPQPHQQRPKVHRRPGAVAEVEQAPVPRLAIGGDRPELTEDARDDLGRDLRRRELPRDSHREDWKARQELGVNRRQGRGHGRKSMIEWFERARGSEYARRVPSSLFMRGLTSWRPMIPAARDG